MIVDALRRTRSHACLSRVRGRRPRVSQGRQHHPGARSRGVLLLADLRVRRSASPWRTVTIENRSKSGLGSDRSYATRLAPHGSHPRYREDRRIRPRTACVRRPRGRRPPRGSISLTGCTDRDRRGQRADHPVRHTSQRRACSPMRHELRRRWSGRHRARQRRCRSRHPPRRDGGERAAVQRDLGGRAHDGADPCPSPQCPPGALGATRRSVGAHQVGGRRTLRKDARHHRPRSNRQARRTAGTGLRHATRGVRSVRRCRASSPAVGRTCRSRHAGRGRATSSRSMWPRRRKPSA